MLTLRRDQLAALAQEPRRAQRARLLDRLRLRFPEACAAREPSTLESFVDNAMTAANQAGRYLDPSLFPFVEALFSAEWTEPAGPAVIASSPLRLPEDEDSGG
jgi:hypothetical protein